MKAAHQIKTQLANKRSMNFLRQVILFLNIFCALFLSVISFHGQEAFKIFLIGDAGDHEEAGEKRFKEMPA
jgi:hypothetical protein